MAEFDFYLTDEERRELVQYIFLNQGSLLFIGDIDKPNIDHVKSIEEFEIYMEREKYYFIILSDFFKEQDLKFTYDEFTKKYYLAQRWGGPYIDISFYLGWPEDSSIKVKRTWIDYYANWIDIEKTDGVYLYEFKASQELKDYVKMLVKFCKSMCKQVVGRNGKKYWVSKEFVERGEY